VLGGGWGARWWMGAVCEWKGRLTGKAAAFGNAADCYLWTQMQCNKPQPNQPRHHLPHRHHPPPTPTKPQASHLLRALRQNREAAALGLLEAGTAASGDSRGVEAVVAQRQSGAAVGKRIASLTRFLLDHLIKCGGIGVGLRLGWVFSCCCFFRLRKLLPM